MKNIIAATAIQGMKKMTTTLALGLAALTLAGTAVAKDQVTRPFFSKSHVEVTINVTEFPTITFASVVTGTAAHLGAYTGTVEEGVVQVDFCDDGSGGSYPCLFTPSGAGELVAANGDTVTIFFSNPGNSPEGAVMTFTGGTGRFENAFGSGIQTQFNVVEVDNGDGTLTLTYDDVIIGEITY